MKAKPLLAALGAVGAIGAFTGPAHAYGLNTNVTFGGSNPGSFNVLMQLIQGTQNSFKVTIKSNDTGPGDGIFDPGTPEHSVSQAEFAFYDDFGGASGAGDSVNSAGDNGNGGTANTWNKNPVTAGGFQFSDPGGSSGVNNIRMNASNQFNGVITLAAVSNFQNVKSMDVRLFNGFSVLRTANFSDSVPNAPEGAGMALLLSGLAPLGMLLRRGRGVRSSPPTTGAA